MNRVERGPLLLIVAGVLLLLAVVAYLINDAEDQSRRIEATYERHALDAQARRSIAEMRALRDENDRIRQDRADIRGQQEEILKSLKRIEKMLERQLGRARPLRAGFLRPAGDDLGRGGIAQGRWIGTESHIEPLARRGSAPRRRASPRTGPPSPGARCDGARFTTPLIRGMHMNLLRSCSRCSTGARPSSR